MTLDLKPRKRIGLVAHDNKKLDLVEWAQYNRTLLAGHDLIATGTPPGVGPLLPGDLVRVEIEGIGALENPVIRE